MAEKHGLFKNFLKETKNIFNHATAEPSSDSVEEKLQDAIQPSQQPAETSTGNSAAIAAANSSETAAGKTLKKGIAAGENTAEAATAQAAAPPKKRRRVFAYTSDPMQTLYNNWLIETDADGVSDDITEHMSKTAFRMENDTDYNFDVNIKRFFMTARMVAKKRLNDYTMAKKAMGNQDNDENPNRPVYSSAAEPIFYITPDGMMVLVAVLPPIGNGSHIQTSQFRAYLQSSNITTGISEDVMKRIVSDKLYFTIFPLVLGKPAIHGKDGEIIERVPREKEITYNENAFGNVDFASRNFLREVSMNDVLCDIISPTKGTDGINIRGQILPAKDGKNAHIPQGKNTVISEDGTQLLAAADGYVVFKNGTFRVIQVLDIPGNVDFSVGNLKYHGGIVIHGDVLNGFEIQAEGDIVIHGVVEAARITSGGSITIHNGMNGNFEGELNAKGDIHSPFLENTLVSSGGDIHTGSLICCDVFCDGTIYADTKMGIIIGGSLTAMHAIKARIIGNKAGRKTELILGTLPHAVKEKDDLEKNAKNMDETMELLQKNINYLQGIPNLPEQKAQLLAQLQQQYQLYSNQKKALEQRHETILKQLDLVDEATIECKTIYPITTITISGVSKKITEVTHNAKIALTDTGEIDILPLK